MFSGYQKLPLVDTDFLVAPDCYLPSTATAVYDPYLQQKPLSIFPNPATAFSEVIFENSGSSFDARMSLHSLGGAILSSTLVFANAGSNVFFIDVSNLPPATYFVRLENKLTGRANVAKLMVAR